MRGWIYCITNSVYKQNNLYKLGYTTTQGEFDSVKHHLLQRYGTYFPDVECVELVPVKHALQAEQHLFSLLQEHKHNKEIYRADYELIIKPQLNIIRVRYAVGDDNEYVVSPKAADKLQQTLVKKSSKFIKHPLEIQNYLCYRCGTMNQHNQQVMVSVHMSLSSYIALTFPPNVNKKIHKMNQTVLLQNLSVSITQFDYSDAEMSLFVEFVKSLQ